MNLDELKNMKFDMSKVKGPELNDLLLGANRQASQIQRLVDEANEVFAMKAREEEQYKEAVLNALQGIEENTGGITEIVKLIHVSNEKQDQVIELLSEIMSISTAKTKEEAQSKFTKALGKINNLGTTVESIQTLVGLLNTVYNTVQPLLT